MVGAKIGIRTRTVQQAHLENETNSFIEPDNAYVKCRESNSAWVDRIHPVSTFQRLTRCVHPSSAWPKVVSDNSRRAACWALRPKGTK